MGIPGSVYWLLIGILLLLYIVARKLKERYLPHPTRLPLDMHKLRWIAYRKNLLEHLSFLPPVLVIVGACYATGRMSAAACLASAVVALIFPMMDLLFLLHPQRTPMLSLPRELAAAVESDLRGKELVYSGNAWGYMDADWYICVGREICTVLWAGCIDFSKPVRCRKRNWYLGAKFTRANMNVPEYLFSCRDGSTLIARGERTPLLEKWIKKHRGRFE